MSVQIEKVVQGFGERLRQLREERGLSQKDLAERAGLLTPQVGRYERGETYPNAEKVAALAAVLQVSTDALLLGERINPSPIELRNLRLLEKLRDLDQLPREEQETALKIIDGVIARYELEHLAKRVRHSP